jgi:hypothetical protein
MTNPIETLLARLFADPKEVEHFLADREIYAKHCGLTAESLDEIVAIDAASLRFAARSFARKRASHGQ